MSVMVKFRLKGSDFMLTAERRVEIVKIVDSKGACKVQELTELLDSSESTIRRDLTFLHNTGKLKKVHGGATSILRSYNNEKARISVKHTINVDEKDRIAEYAASLIEPKESIYIDASTTTEKMVDYITEVSALYITNSINIARRLSRRGFNVYIISGKFKATNEVIIGSEAAASTSRYNFTKGFFGTNGITKEEGYTTPDVDEARVKTAAMERCRDRFILADKSKFDKVSAVTFGDIESSRIITCKLEKKRYENYKNIIEVDL